MGTFLLAMLFLCLVGFFITLLYILLKEPMIYLLGMLFTLEDKDPFDNKCDGLNSLNWTHDYICNKCMSFVGHEERMTDICLSCGQPFSAIGRSVSTRLIIKDGNWVRQIRWKGKDYINKELISNEEE